MKKYFYLAILCFPTILFSQNAPYEIPTVFPASPEASILGKFGDIPVNMSTGTTGFYVPIYDIEEGEYSLPISLNYFNNGLVVNSVPGCLGLGWSINAGGMITRQVRGRPDDDVTGYIGPQMIGLNWVKKYFDGELSSNQIDSLDEFSATSAWDTQPDKFIVNAGDLKATFYFDENKNPVIKPYKPYLIEVINDDFEQGLRITDDKGVIYTFQAKEYSERIPPFIGIGEIIATTIGGYISGWKLTKIQTTNNREIDFTYDDFTHKEKITYQNQSIRLPNNVESLQTTEANYEIKSKLIKKISFDLGEINFNYTSQSSPDFNKYLNRLDNVEVVNLNNKMIKDFDLTYDDNNKTRKLLTNIEINNDVNNNYEFEYNGTPNDNIEFYKQDYWGYANANTSGKLIIIDDLYEPRKPDFNSSVVGVLSKINYPTKGSTEFIYESNTYDPGPDGDEIDDYFPDNGCANLTESIGASVAIHSGNYTPNVEVLDIETFTVTSDVYMTLNLNVVDNAQFGGCSAGLRRISGPPGEVWCADPFAGACSECTFAEISWDVSGGVNTERQEKSFISSVSLKLKPGVYELYATAVSHFLLECGLPGTSNDPFNNCQSLSAFATMQMSDGTPPSIPRSREVGGVRIKQVKSCPDNNPVNCITKEYVYETDEGVSQGHLFRRRNLYTNDYTIINEIINPPNNPQIITDYFKGYSSFSNVPLGSYFGNHVIYKEVIERSLVNGITSNGSKVTKFNFVEMPDPVFPFIDKDAKEYQNGKVLEEHFVNNLGIDDKTIFNEYDFIEDLGLNDRVLSFKARTIIYDYTPYGGNVFLHDTETLSNNFDVDRLVRVRDFSNLESNYLEIDKNFNYSNPKGHLIQEDITNSNGSVHKTEYLYPYDFNTGAYQDLVNKNKLSIPVDVKVYKDNNLLSTQKTEYYNWGSGIIEKQFIKSAKGSQGLENRLTLNNYDAFGNLLEVFKDPQIPYVYIWGYQDKLPIAKLSNITYSSIPVSIINNLKTASNSDNDNCSDNNGCNESLLREELNNLRTLYPDILITTYTYDPLIGISSITDEKGYTLYYKYDDQNRLKYIIDKDQKIIEKTDYNYKN